MKRLLYLLLFLPYNSQAQAPEEIIHSQVLYAKDSTLSKDELYARCLRWFGSTFNSGKVVIDVQDKEAGFLIANPIFQAMIPFSPRDYAVDIQYKLNIEIKPGRVRLEGSKYIVSSPSTLHTAWMLTNIQKAPYDGFFGKKGMQKEWELSKQATVVDFQNSVASLQKTINGKNSDW